MQEVINKAHVLIEALPYIQAFRNAVVVIKFGGSAMDVRENVESVLQDITFMECVGMRTVIVHGGGKAISRGMKADGIEPKFLKGLRVTCDRTIRVVERVMKEDVNPGIVAALEAKGAKARGVHGEEIFQAVHKAEVDADTGAVLDWGFVGEPGTVNAAPILDLLENNVIPVVTPLGMAEDGHIHNMNADAAAAAMAIALKARKLVYLSDVPGLLRDPADPNSLIGTLRISEVEYLIKKGVISGGMLPKVDSGVKALAAGVRKVHMIDGRMEHSLLLEIFTDRGVGTEVVLD